jgi:SLOG cluster2
MTTLATPLSPISRRDLLGGLRVQISGSVPRETESTQPHLNEEILAFVQRLSQLVVLYGGRIVHGNHPGLTPAIVGIVKNTLQSAPGDVRDRVKHAPAVTLVASALWPLPREYHLAADLLRVIQTPAVGGGDARDPQTRNASLTALRLTLSHEADVVIAVGGKIHSETGFNPGVIEELCLARWKNNPCFIIAALGGLVGELDSQFVRAFSAGNKLDEPSPAEPETGGEITRLASRDRDIPAMAGELVAHLVAHRDEFLRRADDRAGWPGIGIVDEPELDDTTAIQRADVPLDLVDQVARRLREVLDVMAAKPPDLEQLGRLLGSPPVSPP